MQMAVDTQAKENEDLKYDNTLLYEKNVEKDERIAQITNDNAILKSSIDNDKN